MMTVQFSDTALTLGPPDAGGSETWLYNGTPYTGIIEQKRNDGTLLSSMEVVQGYPHGLNREYYADGVSLKVEYRMKLNKPYGLYIEYNPDGSIAFQENRGTEP